MPRRIIAARDQRVPTPTVGEFATITYTVTVLTGPEPIRTYTLTVMDELGHLVSLYSSLDKAAVLSMGELTEGQGV